METNYIYLTYLQVMVFMHKLDEMKKENPYFSDGLAAEFENYVLKRSQEMLFTHPQIKLKIVPNANKFKISESRFNYLVRLTKVNPLDREVLNEYKPLIKEAEQQATAKFLNGEIAANSQDKSKIK